MSSPLEEGCGKVKDSYFSNQFQPAVCYSALFTRGLWEGLEDIRGKMGGQGAL